MGEEKTRCTNCGRQILQRTADRNGGVCAICCYRLAAIPPDDFEVPRDVVDRLRAIGKAPEFYRDMVWRDGVERFHGFIDSLEKAEELRKTWFPRLRRFEAECRRQNPIPPSSKLSNLQRAQRWICAKKIWASGGPRVCRDVVIYSLPLAGVVHVDEHLHSEGRPVQLTHVELERWYGVYEHPKHTLDWYTVYNLQVEHRETHRRSRGEGEAESWDEYKKQMPKEAMPVIVSESHLHGGFGNGHEELWSWNGSRAKFLHEVAWWV